eukprot:CAMPEP_0176240682 /NCGR_PEP_ID=MMETSP0121_2-20121125/29502_1 /TAXON_ID=160619 /ORGANISM="Kryptoperidinium foliaceum, Strain CCMP 1326" /LENGTH=90 /DNA_ID=CAMNT_0017580187 /DNA_START=39 /DNA_END=308 /DNA_ORIENTATION=+
MARLLGGGARATRRHIALHRAMGVFVGRHARPANPSSPGFLASPTGAWSLAVAKATAGAVAPTPCGTPPRNAQRACVCGVSDRRDSRARR